MSLSDMSNNRPPTSVANWLAEKPNKSNLAYLKKFGLQNFDNLFSIWLIEFLVPYDVFGLVWLILKPFIYWFVFYLLKNLAF